MFKLNTSNLKQSIAKVPFIADQQGWEISYDREVDALYFSPKKIPDGSRLVNVNKEFNIYVDNNSIINGLFIENFSSNYVKHKRQFEELLKLFVKKEYDKVYTIKNKNTEAIYKGALSSEFLKSVNSRVDMNSFVSRIAL